MSNEIGFFGTGHGKGRILLSILHSQVQLVEISKHCITKLCFLSGKWDGAGAVVKKKLHQE